MLNFVSGLFSTASVASVNVLCEVGPCPCGYYSKKGCFAGKTCATMCVPYGN